MSHTQGFHQHSIIHRWVVIIGCISLAVPLVGYVINGSFMRYSGDDYCYEMCLHDGFLEGSIDFIYSTRLQWKSLFTYLFSDVNGLLGLLTSAMLPGLAIIT
jgi:hypothetical protein